MSDIIDLESVDDAPVPFDPVTSPGHTDLMVSPEAIAATPVEQPLAAKARTEDELVALDVCPTPPALALAICERVKHDWALGDAPVILEPSAGDGAFVRAAREIWPKAKIIAVEIRPECEDALKAAGADTVIIGPLLTALPEYMEGVKPQFDLAVGNPPFAVAEAHVRFLLKLLGGIAEETQRARVLAFLLRMGFYESAERVPFWRECVENSVAPIVPRPGFKLNGAGKKGTDSQAYGLITWRTPREEVAVGERMVLALPTRNDHIVWNEDAVVKAAKRREKRGTPAGERKPRKPRKAKTVGAPAAEPTAEPVVLTLE